ncbi:MAG: MBL fold metallo-hydrolase [Caulobacteraceae bacterium]
MTGFAGIQVRYVYSACVVIRTPDVTVLCDPWFTDGVYDGSWYAFPKVADPMGLIGEVDAVWISHIHPDHYDPLFLRRYFDAFGDKPLLIADHAPNHLKAKMTADGFTPTVAAEPLAYGDTRLEILPHSTGSASDIDSALVVKLEQGGRAHVVVNANDIIFDAPMRRRVAEAAGPIDLLLCGYTGAGPYPQTYFDLDDPALPQAAARKRAAFFERYRTLTAELRPRRTMPFAGQYLLGGRLAHLNRWRGVADAAEVLAFDPDAVVLEEGGSIDTQNLEAFAERRAPYPEAMVEARLAEIARHPMAYERLIAEAEVGQLPLKRLLGQALAKARARSQVEQDHHVALSLGEGAYAVFNCRRDAEAGLAVMDRTALDAITPLSRIEIDPRYLFGLLTHVYHWNNAEVGSGYQTRRHPDVFDRRIQGFLHNLNL